MEWVRWTTMPCPRLLYLKARCISRSRSSTATPVSKRIYQLTEEVIGFPRVVEPLGDIFAQRRWGFGKNGEHADVELRRRARDAGRAGPGWAGLVSRPLLSRRCRLLPEVGQGVDFPAVSADGPALRRPGVETVSSLWLEVVRAASTAARWRRPGSAGSYGVAQVHDSLLMVMSPQRSQIRMVMRQLQDWDCCIEAAVDAGPGVGVPRRSAAGYAEVLTSV